MPTRGNPMKAFDTIITETSDSLVGPWRRPHQMLNAQVYDSHASIHDDATAQKLGFRGGTIEGPTHFSQFAPLCVSLWGNVWFENGCISAHYRNPSFEGEEVQAILAKPEPGQTQCKIQMVKRDGTEVLRGTASVGQDASMTALDQRLTELKPLADQEIRLLRGPLFAGEDDQTEREVVALSGSRRTESLWLRTTVFAKDDLPVAKMLLNLASIKDSYAPYQQEYTELYA